ncbi:cation-transporting P-type ATPase [Bradyrhizobium sp. I71]|uniref:cation-transporting P-type ATPase n=1 Tax=Bradyrhizobium sp. I71 TaxID=2590772 RepID=UPI001EF95482|nr:cation-transporting P-type ATPase [Bradyrhizobium sp. I71]ULK99687.1 hypothetical protein FJV43_08115 [Bradyrhizobium sp. I71]
MESDKDQHDTFSAGGLSNNVPGTQAGLSQEEAERRLVETGPNELASDGGHPVRRALRHFWLPVPWMLEITIVLQLAAGERLEHLGDRSDENCQNGR